MKISKIEVQNVLGAKDVNISAKAKVIVIAGDNYSGKSSTRDAIYQALSTVSTRVNLKKDYAELVTDGSKKGLSVVSFVGGNASLKLPSGDHSFSFDGVSMNDAELMQQAMPFCLDGVKLANVPSDERRRFLFKLMSVKTGVKAVSEMLTKRGCDMAKAAGILPLLVSGFKVAEDEAKEKAKECKGIWKGITKETYGTEKAKNWGEDEQGGDQKAEPSLDIEKAEAEISKKKSVVAAKNKELGGIEQVIATAAERAKRLTDLKKVASTLKFAEETLAQDKENFDAQTRLIEETEALANGDVVKKTYVCPCCSVILEMGADSSLKEHVTPEKIADDNAKKSLPEMRLKLSALQKALNASQLAVEQAKNASAEIGSFNTGDASADAEKLKRVQVEVEQLTSDLAANEKSLKSYIDADLASKAAKKRVEDAMKTHNDVLAYLKIAEAFSPEGIPSELLASALEPFNTELAKSSDVSLWEKVVIEKNLSVTYGGRPYHLCSESEKWRCDATIAEVIAKFSKLKMIMLDRFDCLNAVGRSDMIEWLRAITASGEIESAIVFGTMKDKPVLPSDCQLVWMSAGVSEDWIVTGRSELDNKPHWKLIERSFEEENHEMAA